jgi:hypothetical protein
MPVFKPRDRIVIFRLTQDEYDNLVAVCQKRGARNLTDFTRSEVLASIERELQQQPRPADSTELDVKIESLQAEIQYIRTLLEQQLNGRTV